MLDVVVGVGRCCCLSVPLFVSCSTCPALFYFSEADMDIFVAQLGYTVARDAREPLFEVLGEVYVYNLFKETVLNFINFNIVARDVCGMMS